ncbi:MAG: hypothetical protein J0J05_16700 [Microbacterium sp.]|uniref:hypothetical protein n=1 Tax=Microbacterium sp. TaxID=51671 RepID=UPI001ACCA3C2|nr:hypothetical protein [Microbacterium sp.]MBN9155617.1 hypothetical protein [Microbacterium sp.]
MSGVETQKPMLVAAGSLLFFQASISLIAWALVFFRSIEADGGCGGSCDYTLIVGSAQAYLIGAGVVFLLASGGIYLCWRARRPAWWPPVVGIAIVIGGYFVANALASVGLHQL